MKFLLSIAGYCVHTTFVVGTSGSSTDNMNMYFENDECVLTLLNLPNFDKIERVVYERMDHGLHSACVVPGGPSTGSVTSVKVEPVGESGLELTCLATGGIDLGHIEIRHAITQTGFTFFGVFGNIAIEEGISINAPGKSADEKKYLQYCQSVAQRRKYFEALIEAIRKVDYPNVKMPVLTNGGMEVNVNRKFTHFSYALISDPVITRLTESPSDIVEHLAPGYAIELDSSSAYSHQCFVRLYGLQKGRTGQTAGLVDFDFFSIADERKMANSILNAPDVFKGCLEWDTLVPLGTPAYVVDFFRDKIGWSTLDHVRMHDREVQCMLKGAIFGTYTFPRPVATEIVDIDVSASRATWSEAEQNCVAICMDIVDMRAGFAKLNLKSLKRNFVHTEYVPVSRISAGFVKDKLVDAFYPIPTNVGPISQPSPLSVVRFDSEPPCQLSFFLPGGTSLATRLLPTVLQLDKNPSLALCGAAPVAALPVNYLAIVSFSEDPKKFTIECADNAGKKFGQYLSVSDHADFPIVGAWDDANNLGVEDQAWGAIAMKMKPFRVHVLATAAARATAAAGPLAPPSVSRIALNVCENLNEIHSRIVAAQTLTVPMVHTRVEGSVLNWPTPPQSRFQPARVPFTIGKEPVHTAGHYEERDKKGGCERAAILLGSLHQTFFIEKATKKYREDPNGPQFKAGKCDWPANPTMSTTSLSLSVVGKQSEDRIGFLKKWKADDWTAFLAFNRELFPEVEDLNALGWFRVECNKGAPELTLSAAVPAAVTAAVLAVGGTPAIAEPIANAALAALIGTHAAPGTVALAARAAETAARAAVVPVVVAAAAAIGFAASRASYVAADFACTVTDPKDPLVSYAALYSRTGVADAATAATRLNLEASRLFLAVDEFAAQRPYLLIASVTRETYPFGLDIKGRSLWGYDMEDDVIKTKDKERRANSLINAPPVSADEARKKVPLLVKSRGADMDNVLAEKRLLGTQGTVLLCSLGSDLSVHRFRPKNEALDGPFTKYDADSQFKIAAKMTKFECWIMLENLLKLKGAPKSVAEESKPVVAKAEEKGAAKKAPEDGPSIVVEKKPGFFQNFRNAFAGASKKKLSVGEPESFFSWTLTKPAAAVAVVVPHAFVPIAQIAPGSLSNQLTKLLRGQGDHMMVVSTAECTDSFPIDHPPNVQPEQTWAVAHRATKQFVACRDPADLVDILPNLRRDAKLKNVGLSAEGLLSCTFADKVTLTRLPSTRHAAAFAKKMADQTATANECLAIWHERAAIESRLQSIDEPESKELDWKFYPQFGLLNANVYFGERADHTFGVRVFNAKNCGISVEYRTEVKDRDALAKNLLIPSNCDMPKLAGTIPLVALPTLTCSYYETLLRCQFADFTLTLSRPQFVQCPAETKLLRSLCGNVLSFYQSKIN